MRQLTKEMEKIHEEFRYRDLVTGRLGASEINRKRLASRELDQIMNPLAYE